MIDILIHTTTDHGYLVTVKDSIRFNGEHVFKATEIIGMIEFVGKVILDRKIKVEER